MWFRRSDVLLFSLAAINPCLQQICHLHASCVHTGPNQHLCACHEGYSGDGRVCVPVDPCQRKHGGCAADSTRCVYDGPGKVRGYTGRTRGSVQISASGEMLVQDVSVLNGSVVVLFCVVFATVSLRVSSWIWRPVRRSLQPDRCLPTRFLPQKSQLHHAGTRKSPVSHRS